MWFLTGARFLHQTENISKGFPKANKHCVVLSTPKSAAGEIKSSPSGIRFFFFFETAFVFEKNHSSCAPLGQKPLFQLGWFIWDWTRFHKNEGNFLRGWLVERCASSQKKNSSVIHQLLEEESLIITGARLHTWLQPSCSSLPVPGNEYLVGMVGTTTSCWSISITCYARTRKLGEAAVNKLVKISRSTTCMSGAFNRKASQAYTNINSDHY